MSDTLTLGFTRARVADSLALYRRVLGLNHVLHLLIGLACLLFPHWVAQLLGLPGPIPPGWTRAWGSMLILVSALYVPGWLDPVRVRGPNLIGLLGRVWMGTVWVFCGGGFLWFAAFDFAFALLLGLLYFRLMRDVLMSHP